MSLTRGSIAFVAYSGDDAMESFSFVLLKDVPAESWITFNDWPWTGNAFDTSDPDGGASIAWTSGGATLAAGSVCGGLGSGTAAMAVTLGSIAPFAVRACSAPG